MSLNPAGAAASHPVSPASARADGVRANPFAPRYYTRRELDEESPSLRHPTKALKPKQQATWRKQYVNQIFNVAQKLRLPPQVGCTAILFTHQYYAVRSMQDNDRVLIATAALFLACKVEDHPRSLNDVLRFVFQEKYSKHEKVMAVLRNEQQLACLRDTVLKAERAILYTTGFRLKINHPHTKFLMIASKFKLDELYKSQHSQKRALLTQAGANFLTDCYQTTLPLRHPPDVIALGALYFAVNICKVKVPDTDGKPWCEAAVPGTSAAVLDEFVAELQGAYDQKEVKPKTVKPAGGTPAATQHSKAAAAAAALPPAPGTPSTTATPVSRKPGGVRESTPDEFVAAGKRSPAWQPSEGATESPAKRQRVADPAAQAANVAAAAKRAPSATAHGAAVPMNGVAMQAVATGRANGSCAAAPAVAAPGVAAPVAAAQPGGSAAAAPAAAGANGYSSAAPAAGSESLAAAPSQSQPPSIVPGLGPVAAPPIEPGQLPT